MTTWEGEVLQKYFACGRLKGGKKNYSVFQHLTHQQRKNVREKGKERKTRKGEKQVKEEKVTRKENEQEEVQRKEGSSRLREKLERGRERSLGKFSSSETLYDWSPFVMNLTCLFNVH